MEREKIEILKEKVKNITSWKGKKFLWNEYCLMNKRHELCVSELTETEFDILFNSLGSYELTKLLSKNNLTFKDVQVTKEKRKFIKVDNDKITISENIDDFIDIDIMLKEIEINDEFSNVVDWFLNQ